MSSNALFVGIDSSTTACKAIAFDARGEAVAEGRAPLTLNNPGPGAWEQDAREWWQAFGRATRDLTEQLGTRCEQLRSLCITHQRETVVMTDAGGDPVSPALVWMDARGGAQVEQAKEHLGAEVLHTVTGKPACTTPSLYKLKAAFEREPGLRDQVKRVVDVHGFLAWRLTGQCVTSLASADPMGVVDMQKRAYSEPVLEWLGLCTEELPALVEPGARLGRVSASASSQTGLPEGLVVISGAGDGQCAGVGAGITGPGRAYLNLGTAIVSGVLSDRYQCHPAFRSLYAARAGTYFLETDLKGGTFSLDWLFGRVLGLERHQIDERRGQLEAQACLLPVGADGLVFLPYLNGVMNPYWDDDATGMLFGLRADHGPAHLYRAVLEGIALEQRLHLRGVVEASGPVKDIVLLGGGSKSELWVQIMADVLNRPVERATTSEATALGAAIVGAAGVGAYDSIEAATEAMTRRGEMCRPTADAERYGALFSEVYEGLYLDVSSRMGRLASFRSGTKSLDRTLADS